MAIFGFVIFYSGSLVRETPKVLANEIVTVLESEFGQCEQMRKSDDMSPKREEGRCKMFLGVRPLR